MSRYMNTKNKIKSSKYYRAGLIIIAAILVVLMLVDTYNKNKYKLEDSIAVQSSVASSIESKLSSVVSSAIGSSSEKTERSTEEITAASTDTDPGTTTETTKKKKSSETTVYSGAILPDSENVKFESPVKVKSDVNDYVVLTEDAFAYVNDDVPFFKKSEITTDVFEKYSDYDNLGRCGEAYANICPELMPEEQREDISSVKPSGYKQAKYKCVDGGWLYNRCHLIGYQLAGENANGQNLITGTRYLNITGMLPFENAVADFVKKTGYHVLYRVTPIYQGDNLVADGVLMEGYSVEDKGEGVCFCVFVYNVQPGVAINYTTGASKEI